MKKTIILQALVVMALMRGLGCYAEEAYPNRAISMIVPFPPGGVADITGRPLALSMEKEMKQPVVIVNKPGGGGAIGNSLVANARADGYTLLMTLSSISVIPAADVLFNRKPAYTLDQLVSLALISADPTLLVSHPSLPAKSIAELVALARLKPGQLSFSSSGIYGALHMPMEMFLHHYKLKMRHVPTTGGGPALTALLGGHVELSVGGPAALASYVKAGKLQAYATWGNKRLSALPGVPTFKELGTELEYYIWAGLFAPRGLPPAIFSRLEESIHQAVTDAEFVKSMNYLNSPIQYLNAIEFTRYWHTDAERLAKLVKIVGKVDEKH